MQAVTVRDRAAGVRGLSLTEMPYPHAAENDVIVRVHAAGFTPGELDWPATWCDRAGRDRTPSVPGHELSGVVVELGYGTTGLTVGQRVFGLVDWTRNGALAEYVAVAARDLAPLPADVDHTVAAALPISGLTAWQGLFDHGQLGADERVLIHGASGVVGGFAVQLARARGAHVIGTASGANLGLVRQLGAHEAIDAATRFEDAAESVDLVFDTAGGARLHRSVAVLRAGGRLVSVAEEPPDGGVYFTVEPNREQLRSIARLVDAGELRPPSVDIFQLTSARQAFARSLERGRPRKVVLDVACGFPVG
jgi:NADPH:quinone reductase-like Zn-dependent oxidoreductase